MREETRRALKNYDWMMRNRTDVELHWESGTLIWGDGGMDISMVSDPGFTPATADDVALPEPRTLPAVKPGHVSAEQIVAEAIWDSDMQRERGHNVWNEFRDTVPYAYSAIRALEEHDLLPRPAPRNVLRFKRRVPMPRFANEAELAERVLAILEPHFEVEREVSGRHCSGRRLQVDAVLRPRDPSAWKDDSPAFGVEFKMAHQGSFSTHEFTQWARQAVDYTHAEWNGYGPLYVFACPSPIPASGGNDGWLMAHLLGQFGVGELSPRHDEGWALSIHDNHILWSERQGVAAAKRWSLRRKIGGRR